MEIVANARYQVPSSPQAKIDNRKWFCFKGKEKPGWFARFSSCGWVFVGATAAGP
jgi:hypothetical protein